jgi:PIN domain
LIHVVLDTSIYRMDPKRTQAAFQAFARLCKWGAVTLHVPYFVKREFLSQQHTAIKAAVKSIQTDASTILRNCHHPELVKYADKVVREADEIVSVIESATIQEFENWLQECDAVQHPMHSEHTRRVVESYFSGTPPFTSIKHREDIPDSFIWETMVDLAGSSKPLSVVCNDGALWKAANSFEGMKAYRKLDEFVESDECQQAITVIIEGSAFLNIVKGAALLRKDAEKLAGIAEGKLTDAIHGRLITSKYIPNADHRGMIVLVGRWSPLMFDFVNVEFYGEGVVGIPFDTSAACSVHYRILRADFNALSVRKAALINAIDQDDEYLSAGEEYNIKIKATLLATFNLRNMQNELPSEQLAAVVEDADINVEVKVVDVSDDI